jgi:hypothetical protein
MKMGDFRAWLGGLACASDSAAKLEASDGEL